MSDDQPRKPEWIDNVEQMEREADIKPDDDPNPIVFYVSSTGGAYDPGFRGATLGFFKQPDPPCTDPSGHLWEEHQAVLLSYPRQRRSTCVHCGVTTTRTEPMPKPRRWRDPK